MCVMVGRLLGLWFIRLCLILRCLLGLCVVFRGLLSLFSFLLAIYFVRPEGVRGLLQDECQYGPRSLFSKGSAHGIWHYRPCLVCRRVWTRNTRFFPSVFSFQASGTFRIFPRAVAGSPFFSVFFSAFHSSSFRYRCCCCRCFILFLVLMPAHLILFLPFPPPFLPPLSPGLG